MLECQNVVLDASPVALEDAGMPEGMLECQNARMPECQNARNARDARNAAVIFSFFHQQRDTNTQHDINNNKRRIRIIVIYLNYTYSSSYILKMIPIVVILLNDIPYR